VYLCELCICDMFSGPGSILAIHTCVNSFLLFRDHGSKAYAMLLKTFGDMMKVVQQSLKRQRIDPQNSGTGERQYDKEEECEVTQNEHDEFLRELKTEWKGRERKNSKKIKDLMDKQPVYDRNG